MSRKKLLYENFLIYGMGSVMSKIIPFIMLPVITFLLPDEKYFGINDLFTTVTSFCCSFGLFGMTDAAYRFFFDEDDLEYKKKVCSTSAGISVIFTLFSVIVLLLLSGIITDRIYGSQEYYFLIVLNVFAIYISNVNSFLMLPTRMLNKRKVYLAVNTFIPVVTYSAAILMLYFGWYLCALPLAFIFSGIFSSVIYGILNAEWFSYARIDRNLVIDLIKFGLPIMPQHLMYYIINSCDKFMIAVFLGQSLNGLYAVGGKFGQISQIIYVAFAGGWSYYRYSTMNEADQVDNISVIFETIGVISFVAFVFGCILSKPVIEIFFKKEYYESFIVIPYLFLSPLIQMMFQIVAGQFTILKKTWINLVSLLMGVVCNVVLNYVFIPIMGIEGASFSTLIGYIVTLIICSVACLKCKMLQVQKKFSISIIITVLFFVIWRLHTNDYLLNSLIGIISIMLMLVLYRREMIIAIKKNK